MGDAPSRAEWGRSQVHADLPEAILDDLAKTVTPLNSQTLAQALVNLMTMMEHYGPQLVETYGIEYPEASATAVAHMVSQMLT